ncbi:MAG: PLP-dependent aminotransferase family protein, partial [Sphingobacteriia bacterium]|nr:PLP-dependent aminotransferase family protein [Sphingobacteriia bacterium]
MLWTEGYILHRQGAASRVARGLCLAPGSETAPVGKPEPAARVRFDFKTGQPDLHLFPWAQWNGLIRETALLLPPDSYAYGDPKGYAPLCEQIAMWMLRSRGMAVKPEDVFITAGTTHAFHVLAAVLKREG